MAGADLAGVDAVVAEVAVGDVAVLVAEQAPARDRFGVELDLRLGFLRDGLERPGEVLDEDLARFGESVDVVVGAVALVGQLLHEGVVVVAHAEADGGEGDAALGLFADPRQDRLGPRRADIGDAVGAQQDAVARPCRQPSSARS